MERRLCIKNFSSAGVSALTYLPVRREIVAGFEGMFVHKALPFPSPAVQEESGHRILFCAVPGGTSELISRVLICIKSTPPFSFWLPSTVRTGSNTVQSPQLDHIWRVKRQLLCCISCILCNFSCWEEHAWVVYAY